MMNDNRVLLSDGNTVHMQPLDNVVAEYRSFDDLQLWRQDKQVQDLNDDTVWHKPSERPERPEMILVVRGRDMSVEPSSILDTDNSIIKWAYQAKVLNILGD